MRDFKSSFKDKSYEQHELIKAYEDEDKRCDDEVAYINRFENSRFKPINNPFNELKLTESNIPKSCKKEFLNLLINQAQTRTAFEEITEEVIETQFQQIINFDTKYNNASAALLPVAYKTLESFTNPRNQQVLLARLRMTQDVLDDFIASFKDIVEMQSLRFVDLHNQDYTSIGIIKAYESRGYLYDLNSLSETVKIEGRKLCEKTMNDLKKQGLIIDENHNESVNSSINISEHNHAINSDSDSQEVKYLRKGKSPVEKKGSDLKAVLVY